jgi:hypothetical protein
MFIIQGGEPCSATVSAVISAPAVLASRASAITGLLGLLPTAAPADGGFWNNGGEVASAPGPAFTVPLPHTKPAQGGLYWNNNNVLAIS